MHVSGHTFCQQERNVTRCCARMTTRRRAGAFRAHPVERLDLFRASLCQTGHLVPDFCFCFLTELSNIVGSFSFSFFFPDTTAAVA